ncbi:MAG TPA: DNA recombination protein RmuC [Gemmatimonadales bacterium]|nr:DNA recombination protein RmuC [Gemmatimonadales bacterium]
MTAAALVLLVVAVGLLIVLVLRRPPAPGSEAALLQQQLVEVRGRLDALVASQGAAVGDVRERLGRLVEATGRLEAVGQTVAKVQELLQVPRLRGTLGEVWLEELLRQVLPEGLWTTQYAFRSGERVDAVITVGDRLVPVDAKFPLEACQRMLAADAAGAERERRAFRRSLRDRIDEIADKYIRPDEGTFEFALMYVPAESVYYEAVVRGDDAAGDDSVVGYALRRKVIPVSPNTFYAYLAAILHGLKGLEVEKRARSILESLGGLQQEFLRLDAAYRLVGKHLDHAVRQYGEAERQIGLIQERLAKITGVGAATSPGGEQPALPPDPGGENGS